MPIWQIKRCKEDYGYSYIIDHLVPEDEKLAKYDEVWQPHPEMWVYVIKQKYPDDAFCEALKKFFEYDFWEKK